MNIETVRDFCLSMPGVEEGTPFGPNVLVFKVGGKMFLLLPLNESPVQFNAKCEPEEAVRLREEYSFIIPGYHMNKKHWNTVIYDSSQNNAFYFDLIDRSYELVKSSLPRKEQALIASR
jgi:predicted DNA-binding protein (MmcQ/YjbR family)